MKKRITAFVLMFVLLFTTVLPTAAPVEASEGTYTYVPQKAVDYADKYWNNYNDFYPNYNSIGGDCANFVSQCLQAGGLPMNGSWYHAVTGCTRSSSWTYANTLYTYLAENCGSVVELYPADSGYTNQNGKAVNPANVIRVGDPVFYYSDSKGRYSHAAICVGYDSKGNPQVSAHNNDHSHVTWTLGKWGHWAVVQLRSAQSVSGLKAVPSSALTYKGELWKTIWLDSAGNEMPKMYLYSEASTSSEYVKSSGVGQTVLLSSVLPVSVKKQVSNELWGKVVYNGLTGWVMLQKGNTQYARKLAEGTGAVTDNSPSVAHKVTSITLDTTNVILAKSATKTIKVKTYKPSNASIKKVNWSTSNGSVATVDAEGKVKGVGPGTATITATAADGSGVKAKCKVTVSAALYKITATSVKVRQSPKSESSYIGTLIPKDTIVLAESVKTSGKEKWGKVKYGGKTGWFCITKSKTYAKAISSYTSNPVTKITLNKSNAALYGKNSTVTISVKSYSPSKPTLKGVVWSSSNVKVATVSTSGKVTAVKEGTAVITATAKDGSGVYAKCKITVHASKPGKPTIKSLKNSSGKQLKVTLSKKVSGAAGYEVEYSTSSNFKTNVKKVTTKSTSVTLKNLTKGKKYYVRVRAYKTENSGKLYGSYSSVKSLKVTK